MSFELELSKLNEHFFFGEFTYSKTTFKPTPTSEFELADSIILIDDLIVIFQLKERHAPSSPTEEGEEQWFKRKVIAKGASQVRDTLNFLATESRIQLENHRGHRVELETGTIRTVHKLVCYLPDKKLPKKCRRQKFYRSRTAGIIHLFDGSDYLGVVRALLTPSELSEYLDFREELIGRWGSLVNEVPEAALVGQYILGDADNPPSADFLDHLQRAGGVTDDWDISGIIKRFPDRITTPGSATDYYSIVTQLAKLKRNELREFKKRFELAIEKCRVGEFTCPYRISIPRTDCAFVFIPVEKALVHKRREGLLNLTLAAKYDAHMSKALGITFVPDEGDWYSVEWCYMEFPWEKDEELETMIKSANPFRSTKEVEIPRY